MQTLLPCLKPGSLGILDWSLYSVARAGTKRAIDDLRCEMSTCLEWLGSQKGTVQFEAQAVHLTWPVFAWLFTPGWLPLIADP